MIHFFHSSFDAYNGVEIAFDAKTCTIHLLEKNDGRRRLAEGIEFVQQQITHQSPFFSNPTCQEIRWLFYRPEGIVEEYRQGEWIELNMSHKEIYLPFSKKMMMQKACSKINGGM
ncbi:hypothetical protein GE107_09515 [Cohnella sp. CFH 77786]|uniref:hypothetical protein n=1 Tax=Cohnella sp. CFH 77786 TaxID=2662265 RepID=UPI001C60E331|nr:hypothetical protein [Cohnella sp. CFH 77786]MBW5446296.1 hypothetical protein [Cohnella sp. CFH 77786]